MVMEYKGHGLDSTSDSSSAVWSWNTKGVDLAVQVTHLQLMEYKGCGLGRYKRIIVQELCESRWPSWAVRPNEPSGFRGCKNLLNHASALVTACP